MRRIADISASVFSRPKEEFLRKGASEVKKESSSRPPPERPRHETREEEPENAPEEDEPV